MDNKKPEAEIPTAEPHGTTPAESNEAGLTLSQVVKAWKQVSAAVRPYKDLNALLNSCKVLDLKKGTLSLGFSSEILRARAEAHEYKEIIQKAIKEVLGADLAIKCIVSSAKQKVPPDVKADGMVAAALKAGGEIVDIQE